MLTVFASKFTNCLTCRDHKPREIILLLWNPSFCWQCSRAGETVGFPSCLPVLYEMPLFSSVQMKRFQGLSNAAQQLLHASLWIADEYIRIRFNILSLEVKMILKSTVEKRIIVKISSFFRPLYCRWQVVLVLFLQIFKDCLMDLWIKNNGKQFLPKVSAIEPISLVNIRKDFDIFDALLINSNFQISFAFGRDGLIKFWSLWSFFHVAVENILFVNTYNKK